MAKIGVRSDTSSEATAGRATRLVVGVPYEPSGFNEVYRNYTGGGGYFVANNVFNRLVVVDIHKDGTIRPDLAERWEILDGGARYRFHLRQARWHDGRPVRPDDVRETYLTAIRNNYRAAASLGDVKDVVAHDERTVDITLHKPNSGFLAQLSIFVWTHILPAHLYAGTDWPSNPANERPVGTGPYMFKEWRRGDGVTIIANPDYHNGRPALDEIEFKTVGDVSESLDGLISGEIDFLTQDVPCERYDEIDSTPGVGVSHTRGNALGHVTFNLDRRPWSDRRVREAVARLIDRDALARAVCSRSRPARHAYLEHIEWAFEPGARFPDHDPVRAEQLLDEAGLRRSADGTRVRARLVCRDLFGFWQRAADALAAAFGAAGIRCEVVRLDAVQWNEQVVGARDFDLMVDGLGIGPDPVLFEEVLRSDNVLNAAHYQNPKLDALFDKGKAALGRDERAAAYREAQRIIADDLPRIHLLNHGNHVGYRRKWAGWSWDPAVRGTLPFWSLERVHLANGSPRPRKGS
jgi:ABC-type transport system substrate-binding protein